MAQVVAAGVEIPGTRDLSNTPVPEKVCVMEKEVPSLSTQPDVFEFPPSVSNGIRTNTLSVLRTLLASMLSVVGELDCNSEFKRDPIEISVYSPFPRAVVGT